jgi:hypothetical protein
MSSRKSAARRESEKSAPKAKTEPNSPLWGLTSLNWSLSSPFIPCTLRQLPSELLLHAARTAVELNPANRPHPLVPFSRIAVQTTKFWGAKGVKLGVAFLDGGGSELQNRILAHMNAWNDGKTNVQFLPASPSLAEVRITRTPGEGYYSYLGTDILHIPKGQNTMNLDSFSMNTPESEYHRVVRHETGHTLGAVHEHLRRAEVARLDVNKTIAYFERTQGWSADEVRAQVLTPIEESALLHPTPVDDASIMCYQLPGSITVDGRPIIGGTDIDPSDAAYMASLYPMAGDPNQPPPPPPGGGLKVTINFAGRQLTGILNDDGSVSPCTWNKK